jgi:hypothetical protein
MPNVKVDRRAATDVRRRRTAPIGASGRTPGWASSRQVLGHKASHPFNHCFDVVSLKLVEMAVVCIVPDVSVGSDRLLDELVIRTGLGQIRVEGIKLCAIRYCNAVLFS